MIGKSFRDRDMVMRMAIGGVACDGEICREDDDNQPRGPDSH